MRLKLHCAEMAPFNQRTAFADFWSWCIKLVSVSLNVLPLTLSFPTDESMNALARFYDSFSNNSTRKHSFFKIFEKK